MDAMAKGTRSKIPPRQTLHSREKGKVQIKEAEKDGRQKEEMAGDKRAKERVAKAGSRSAKAEVYGRSMTSWAITTSSSSRRRKDRNSGSRKMHGEAMKLGGNTALDP